MPNQSPVRYRLSKSISAVKLREHPGSSLRSPTENLIQIPADSVVELEGAVASSGLVNILWNGEAFSIFYGDLESSELV